MEDNAAAPPISGDDGNVGSYQPPVVKEQVTSVANASPRLHLASVDDEQGSPPSPTFERTITLLPPASQDLASSLVHPTDILESEAECDQEINTAQKSELLFRR